MWLVVSTFHPLLCLLVLSFKLHLNLHLSTQHYKTLQWILVMLFFLQELDFEPSVSPLSGIAESFQLVCLALVLGWVKLSQGMVDPVLRLSDPLAAFLSSFRFWPAVSRSHSSSGDCSRAESCGSANISNWLAGWWWPWGFFGLVIFSFTNFLIPVDNLSSPKFTLRRSVNESRVFCLPCVLGFFSKAHFSCVVVGFVFCFLVLVLFKGIQLVTNVCCDRHVYSS